MGHGESGWTPELIIYADSAITSYKADKDVHVTFGYSAGEVEIVLTGCADVPSVVYGVDNHVRDYAGIEADAYFFAHNMVGFRMGVPTIKPGGSFIDGMGINVKGEGPAYDTHWLPCAHDPAVFTPGKPWSERQFDAALIGVIYASRQELLYALLATGRAQIAYGMGALYAEYAAAYQNSRISLVRSAASDVAIRVWETAAMGCLVLMDDCPDCEALGLVDGVNCLLYHSVDEAVNKFTWALEHQEKAEKIAKTGQKWAAPGTWDTRLQVIIDWAEGQSKPKRKAKNALEN